MKLTAKLFLENDNSVTLSLNEINLIANEHNLHEAKLILAKDLLKYAQDYNDSFEYWSADPNRQAQIFYVSKILELSDLLQIEKLIDII